MVDDIRQYWFPEKDIMDDLGDMRVKPGLNI